jgi:hypothetical protein
MNCRSRQRDSQEIDDYLDRRCESFETAASRPPRDEDSSLMLSIIYLMLRSARRARLEARTALLQLFFLSYTRFPDSLESGNRGRQGRDGCPWGPAFAEATRTALFSYALTRES